MSGVARNQITKLGCEKYFCRDLHTEHRWRCSYTISITQKLLHFTLGKAAAGSWTGQAHRAH